MNFFFYHPIQCKKKEREREYIGEMILTEQWGGGGDISTKVENRNNVDKKRKNLILHFTQQK